jgi:DNA-binding response OmpR family regulator
MSRDAILIIDDDADLRGLIRLAVELSGVEADIVEAATCCEGAAALRARGARICLVLLDYFMPGMDPISCARELCQLADPTTIVLCTAATDPAGRAAEVGLSRWLAKPFALGDLERLVRASVAASHPVSR